MDSYGPRDGPSNRRDCQQACLKTCQIHGNKPDSSSDKQDLLALFPLVDKVSSSKRQPRFSVTGYLCQLREETRCTQELS